MTDPIEFLRCSGGVWGAKEEESNICGFKQTYVSFAHIVGVFVDVPGEPKVTNLHNVVLREQDVPRGQVTVDALEGERGHFYFT